MKKSIFLFFAAILCAMTANAQLYLRGGFNGWDATDAYKFVSNVCSVELAGGTTYEFKVADSGWGTNYGGSVTFTATATKTLSKGSNTNAKITTTIPGTYKFEFVESTKKLTVTYPELPAPHDITVRAKVPAHWTNDIYAHVWTSENGSGQDVGPLTKNGDYYEVTKNAGALYVIFKNGSAWSNKNQTVDLCYTEDVCLQLNQSGTDKATATVIDCGAVAKDITVKAVVPEAWGDNVWAHVWETGASGTDVKLTEKEGNWYVYTKNCLELNIIFKSGEGWSNIEQTADIKGIKENTCYSVSSINKTDGKCNVTVEDCDATIEPEVKPEDVYTVVGSSAELGLAWDPAKEANDMEKQGDGSYKKVYSNVELTSDVEWKIAKNDSWWNDTPLENKADNGNSVLVIAKSGIYNVTFTLSADLKTAHAEAELLEETNTVADCFISGNAALTGGAGWEGNEFKMEYAPATETYSYTLTGLAAETAYELQVVLGGNWYGYEKLQTIPTGVENKEGHIAFTLTEAGNVTVTYHATNGINLTGNFAVPETKYYIAGTENLTGFDWKENGLEMTKEGDVYKHTFSEKAAGTYEFKITNGTWTDPWGFSNLAANYVGVEQGKDGEGNPNGNIKIVTEEAKNIIVIFDPANNKITLQDWEVAAPATVTYVLMGVEGDWTTGIEMDVNPDNDKEYMLTCQAISATDAVKVVKLEDGEQVAWYGSVKDGVEVTVTYDDMGNIQLSEGYYNFYFDSSLDDKQLWIAAATDCEAGEEIGDILDLTMTNLVVTPNGTFDLLEASENEYGISVTLGVDTDGDLIEGSNVTMNGETELPINYDLSGKFTKSTDAENGDVYSGLVVVEFDGGLMGLQLTMYASTIEVTEVNLTGGTVTLNDFGAYVMSAKWDTEDVIVELTALEMEDWVSIAIGEDQILSGMATVTNQDGVVTLEAKGLEEYNEEWTQVIAIYDITITATLDLQNVTVYFINTPKWNTPIYAYATKKTGWGRYQEVIAENAPSPGEEATKEDYQIAGYDVYSYTALEGTYNSVQFSGGSEATDDAGWESDMYYIHDFDGNSGWYTRTDAEALLTPDPEPDPDPTPDPEVTEITLTEGDNSIALATTGVVTVTVERVFEKDSLYTIALPFTINNAASVFGYGTVVYNFANLAYDETNEEYILGFTTVNKIEAGKPYLIQPGQNVNRFVAENVTLSPATSISQKVTVDEVEKIATMTAVLSETTTGGSYWLAENRFLYNGTVNMPALRALFVLPTTPSGMPARARVALKEDAATGVEDLFTTEAPVKVIVNGQLIIIRDGVKYNVQGQVIR